MKKEIEKAVDTFHRIAFGTKRNGSKYISESKLASFISILTELLFARYSHNWYPEDPDRGSGYRCIRVNNQSIDPTVKESMRRSQISLPNGLLGTEVTIWVDPGVVSMRIGEDGSIGFEVVDEDVYNKSKKLKASRMSMKRSGSTEDDTYSSRSSSPDSRSSESGSPPLSLSPTPRFTPSTPRSAVSSDMEYNPYSPPAHVSYPHRFQRNPSPQQPSKSLSPPARAFQSMAQPSPTVSPLSAMRSPASSLPQAEINQSSPGHIPVSSPRPMAYTRPRSLFSAPADNSSLADGLNSISYSPYSMPMGNYRQTLPTANFYDIPAMA